MRINRKKSKEYAILRADEYNKIQSTISRLLELTGFYEDMTEKEKIEEIEGELINLEELYFSYEGSKNYEEEKKFYFNPFSEEGQLREVK